MSTNNVCFYGELTKIITELSSNTLLIFPLRNTLSVRMDGLGPYVLFNSISVIAGQWKGECEGEYIKH